MSGPLDLLTISWSLLYMAVPFAYNIISSKGQDNHMYMSTNIIRSDQINHLDPTLKCVTNLHIIA